MSETDVNDAAFQRLMEDFDGRAQDMAKEILALRGVLTRMAKHVDEINAGAHVRQFCSSVYCLNNGSILLIKHKKLDMWLPVGGKREGHETPLETARRELLEETGIDDPIFEPSPIPMAPPGFFGYLENTTPWKVLHMVHMFLATVPTTEVKPDASFSEWAWLTPEQVMALRETTENVRWAGAYIAEHLRIKGHG